MEQKCSAVHDNIKAAIDKKRRAIVDIINEIKKSGVKIKDGTDPECKVLKQFSEISSDKIDAAVDCVREHGITTVGVLGGEGSQEYDITNEKLKGILVALGMDKGSKFFSSHLDPKHERFLDIPAFIKSDGTTANNLVRRLCHALVEYRIAFDDPTKEQQAINCNRLLHAAQSACTWSGNSSAAGRILADNPKLLNNIVTMYNANLPEGINEIFHSDEGWMSQVADIIRLAMLRDSLR